MPRPRKKCRLRFRPCVCFFKPKGVPLRQIEEVYLHANEIEALKLHDVDGLEHQQAAKKMGISQPTFTRILDRTYKKIAQALIQGKAIRVEQKQLDV